MATISKGRTFVSGETVTPAKLNELVDNATLSAIQTADIADGQITNAKVSASASIDLSKLGTGALPTAITVASANIVDGTIVDADINASAAIAGSKLADGGITASKLNGAQTGSAPIYACRAWVNFDGSKDSTGAASTANTNRLIRASGNVASVLRNGAGDYTITFTTAMSDANYCAFITTQSSPANGPDASGVFYNRTSNVTQAPLAGSFRVGTLNTAGNGQDREYIMVSVFR